MIIILAEEVFSYIELTVNASSFSGSDYYEHSAKDMLHARLVLECSSTIATKISKYHFNFCCQHQITYFISCPVKHCKATRRIRFASVVRPRLPQSQARFPTGSFNYGQISDLFAVFSTQIEE